MTSHFVSLPNQTRLDWLLASLTPGLGPSSILRLIQAFGSISEARRADLATLSQFIRPKAAQALLQGQARPLVEQALAWEQTPNASLLTLQDADYPLPLAETASPPALLFALGQRALLTKPMFAIVGSRNASPQGCTNAYGFAAGLAHHGYTIVSGLASGIDSAAHRGALTQPASSIAVIGTGIDRVYPPSNQQLSQQLALDGLILSEYPLGTAPLAQHFPRRNRIIAGLAVACLVVEASLKSGSLITARLAAEYGRDVMAIPGTIHQNRAHGCHRLIKDGAALVETVDDALHLVAPPPVHPALATITATLAPASTGHPLLDAIGHEIVTLDELVSRLGLTVAELYAILLQLELEGRVAPLPGGRFQRIDPLPVKQPPIT